MSDRLLQANEPEAFRVRNAEGSSPFILLCDHAGRLIPEKLGKLGLTDADLNRHIGWDIGALAVSEQLSDRLDATLISQTYSRLVIDCNRPPAVESAFPVISEATRIPGNEGLSEADKRLRRREIFDPYHAEVRKVLEQRHLRGQPTCIIAMHSFTPIYLDIPRPWHIGVLYHRLKAYPQALLTHLRQQPQWVVGDNQPYTVSDETDYALPQHAEKNALPAVAIEIRQDLITEPAGQAEWAESLAPLLCAAWADYLRNQAQ